MSEKLSERLGLAVGAANQKSGEGSVSEPTGECPLVDCHPPVFIDAHMHIQSGGCAPLPPLHARMKGFQLGRARIDQVGKWGIVQFFATGKIGDISPLPTDSIGEAVVKENNSLAYLGNPAQASYLGICIVLTMDMDFCHIDGYEGIEVYFHDTDTSRKGQRYYLIRHNGTHPRSEAKRAYIDWREDWPLDAEEKNREIRELEQDTKMPEAQRKARIAELEKERRRLLADLAKEEFTAKNPYSPPIDPMGMGAGSGTYATTYYKEQQAFIQKRVAEIEAEMAKKSFLDSGDQTLDLFLKDLNTSLFETWKQQILRTERVTVANPLRLLPMFHYEPRRYIKEDGSAPFKRLVEQGGVFVGFKMYTSQGYMPDENTTAGEKVRGITQGFFSQCAAQDIPIMAHCTPAGFFTHQRELYLDLASEETRKLYTRYGEKEPTKLDRIRYFQEHFVHPDAWRPVLEKNKNLRLCCAHFASDKQLWRDKIDEFRKKPLTKKEMNDLFLSIDERRADAPLGRRDEVSLFEDTWGVNGFSGAAKPSMDESGVLYGKGWIRTIVEMCGEFPNFYTDISYLPLWERQDSRWNLFGRREYTFYLLGEILERYPYMVNKIMFGTDWYMILLDNQQYMAWFKQTIAALEATQRYLKGKYLTWNLFHQFAIINPIKFYRLHERHPQIKAAIEGKIGSMKGIDAKKAREDLARQYETLKRLDAARLAQMEEDVKKGPLKFTVTEIDQ